MALHPSHVAWHLTLRVSLSLTMTAKLHIPTTVLQFLVIILTVAASKEDAPHVQPSAGLDLANAIDGKLNTTALSYGLQWSAWKLTHRKSYMTLLEELERFVIWRANQAFIDYHNSYADKLGFTLRMNQFGDLVRERRNNNYYPAMRRFMYECKLPQCVVCVCQSYLYLSSHGLHYKGGLLDAFVMCIFSLLSVKI